MIAYNLTVRKHKLGWKNSPSVLSGGSSGLDYITFEFVGEEWTGLAKSAFLYNADKSASIVQVITGDKVAIPAELMLTAGTIHIGVRGSNAEGDVLTTTWLELFVVDGITGEGIPPAPPTPEVYDQILAVAMSANAVANSVRADADAGIFNGAEGPQGATGPAGPQGIKGDKGDAGAVGPQGIKGDKGDKGDQGEAGLQGLKGDTGAVGPQGLKGDTGAVGPQGIKGDQGETGLQGIKGDKGDQGEAGAVGPVGPQGIQGIQGETGLQGPAGVDGVQGVDGQGVPTGGTAGQVLVKASGADFATEWQTPLSVVSPYDLGDIVAQKDNWTDIVEVDKYGHEWGLCKGDVLSVEDYPYLAVSAQTFEVIGCIDNIVPALTSNSTPAGYVVSGNTIIDPPLQFQSFDKSLDTMWISTSFTEIPDPAVLELQLPSPVTVLSYSISVGYPGSAPLNFVLEGFDGAGYVLLDIQNGVEYAWDGTKVFTVANPESCTKLRLTVSATSDGGNVNIKELVFSSSLPVSLGYKLPRLWTMPNDNGSNLGCSFYMRIK